MKCFKTAFFLILITLSADVYADLDEQRPEGVSDHKWNSLKSAVQEAKLLPSPSGIGGSYSQFSESVSVEGDRALIGAPNILGTGVAILLEYDGIEWIEVAVLKPSDGQQDDKFGHTVSLYQDRALIGAYSNEVSAPNSGAAYVFDFNGQAWLETHKLVASDGALNDHFGHSVSLSENRALVSALQDDDQGHQSGSVYVFDFDGNDWDETDKLSASDGSSNDFFGWSISLNNDRVLIGAYLDDDLGNDSGSVYIFDFDGVSWTESSKLIASDGEAGDEFGYTVSLSTDRILIGAINGDGLEDDSGSAYVFDYDGTVWTESHKLTASDGSSDDHFGRVVSLSENRVLVGAYKNNSPGTESGSVYVFDHDGVSWVESQKVSASDGSPYDWFGYSVSLSGDRMLIGAYYDHTNVYYAGSAYVFDFDDSSWSETQKLTASEGAGGDAFGNAVSIFGNRAMIGAYRDTELYEYNGAVYIFDYDGIDWIETQKITANEGSIIKNFGHSVSLNGDRALIGATNSAHVVEFNGTNWTETQKLTASDGTPGQPAGWYGNAVSLFDHWALIGAFRDDDLGTNSGSAYLFHYDGVQWTETQKVTASDGSAFDYFGNSVSIFGDRLLIGASNADANEAETGAAYVFEYDGMEWLETHKLSASDGASNDGFGGSISLAEDRALLGAAGNFNHTGNYGSAYIYDFDGTDWTETRKLISFDNQPIRIFGISVSLSGNQALIGSALDHDNGIYSGYVHLFELNGGNWEETQSLTVNGGEVSDRFGSAVSLSGDLALVGAEDDDDHGNNAGSAYVFDLIPEYNIKVSVTGLAATNTVSFNNGTDTLTVSTNGTETLSNPNDGSAFDVDITAQPDTPNQTCSFTSADSGTLNGADVTVTVECVTIQYSVGGSVSGLAVGNEVVLQNNSGDDLTVLVDGSFTFVTPQDDESNYTVTVLTNPTTPNQVCHVSLGAGQLAGVAVDNITVECVTSQYNVSGSVTGLALGNEVVLQNNSEDNLTVSIDGSFTFDTPLDDESTYTVTVLTNPITPNQVCQVSQGIGQLAGADVNNVTVSCATDLHTVGGNVSGLAAGNSLTLSMNSGEEYLVIDDNSTFEFVNALEDGSSYEITVFNNPTTPSQTCTIKNNLGTLNGSSVMDVVIDCQINQFFVGGYVVGLIPGNNLILQNKGSDDLMVMTEGPFIFTTPLDDEQFYVVNIQSQPSNPIQTCEVINDTGSLAGDDVDNVFVDCEFGDDLIFRHSFDTSVGISRVVWESEY